MTPLAKAAQQARDATARRDRLVVEQRAAGKTLREIAEEAQLSHTAIARILERTKP